MLDYKSIINKRYALNMSYKELAEEFSASKSGINDFIRAFEKCENCRIHSRRGSRIMRSLNWSTGMNPEPTIGAPTMSRPILPRCISRWRNAGT